MKAEQANISAILMASGYSKRMGQNKLLLPFGHTTLLGRMLDILHASGVIREMILVARENDVIQAGKARVDRVIKNETAEQGISQSIRLGTKKAKEDFYLFMPGDQPLLEPRHIRQIGLLAMEGKIVAPCANGVIRGPCLFSNVFKRELCELEGEEGGKKIIQRHAGVVIQTEISPSEALEDADTWDIYKKMLKKINLA